MSRISPRILLLHIPSTDPLRRIYRLADCRSGTLDSPDGRSFDQSAEAATTTARPPLSLLICPCLSLLSTDYCLTPCCHTLRRCSLTVRTLCLRREELDHDPPAVTTRNSYRLSFLFRHLFLFVVAEKNLKGAFRYSVFGAIFV